MAKRQELQHSLALEKKTGREMGVLESGPLIPALGRGVFACQKSSLVYIESPGPAKDR